MQADKTRQWFKSLFITRKRRSIWIVVVVLVGVVWLLKYEVIEDYIPKRFGVVEKGRIYRSGQLDAELVKRTLVKYKIGVIVSLSGDSLSSTDKNAERQAAAELGIKTFFFPLRGNGTGDINNYARAIALICQAGKEQKPVLVHCSAGAQRTGGVIAAYRLLVQKKDVSFILAEMRRYGWNPGHSPNLLPYLNGHMKELAILLKQMGVIADVPRSLPQIGPADRG